MTGLSVNTIARFAEISAANVTQAMAISSQASRITLNGVHIPNPVRELTSIVVEAIRAKEITPIDIETLRIQLSGGAANFDPTNPRWPNILSCLERNGFHSPSASDTAACDLATALRIDLDPA